MLKIFQFLQKGEQAKYNRRIAKLYKEVFSTPNGKEVLCDLIANSCILESTEGDLIKEGTRKCILRILGILEYNPQKFQKLTKEITDNELEEDD